MPLREDLEHDARIEMETEAAYDEHETHTTPDPECWLCTERARDDLADLRTPGPSRELWARLGVDHMVEAITCPLCRCNKSGSADEPNLRTEACEDNDCHCHDD